VFYEYYHACHTERGTEKAEVWNYSRKRPVLGEIFTPFSILEVCFNIQGGSNMTGTDLCVNKPHCAAAVRP